MPRVPGFDPVTQFQKFDAERKKKGYPTDPNLKRDLEPGFLMPYLLPIESMLWGRWDYWAKIHFEGELPQERIPQIDFIGMGDSQNNAGQKMWNRCIEAVGGRGWSLGQNIEYILDWALFGFGAIQELPPEPHPGASMRLYQLFDLWPLLIWPYDYIGDIMAEAGVGKGSSFYPTPHEIVEAMTMMTMDRNEDLRAKTVSDCCCGTGRMLLHASNHSLRLFGQDISALACKATIFHGFLYAPWLVKPFEWNDENRVVQSDLARDVAMIVRLERMLRLAFPPDEERALAPPEKVFEPVEEPAPQELEPLLIEAPEADFVIECAADAVPQMRAGKKKAPREEAKAEQLSFLEF